MAQSKKGSIIEAISNTAVGFIISWLGAYLIYPLVGIKISHSQNFIVLLFFTLLSILRRYVIRRYFTKKVKFETLATE